MEDNKKQLEDMKIQYISSNDGKEYALTIGKIKNDYENSFSGTDQYGGYLGIDLTTGEITREYSDEGIPQPYTAGTATTESLNMLREASTVQKEEIKADAQTEQTDPKNMKVEEMQPEETEVMKQLIELLEQQNMQGPSQEMKEIYQYMAGMQFQLSAMAEELHNVKEQLSQAVDHQPVPVKEKLAKQAEQLEEKFSGLMERLMEMKNTFLDTAKQVIQTFREKGQAGLNKVLNTAISSVKKMLSEYRNQLSETLMDFEKTANQIDSIGDEIKQIGNSTANIGRLLVGKGAKEMSEEKPGVALTRIINAPIKRHITHLKSGIEKTGKMCSKLEQVSNKLEFAGKDERKPVNQEEKQSGRESVKERLAQMKEKTALKKQPEKQLAAAKEQAVSM